MNIDWDGVASEADDDPMNHLRQMVAEREVEIASGKHINTYILLVAYEDGGYRMAFKGNSFIAVGMMAPMAQVLINEETKHIEDSY